MHDVEVKTKEELIKVLEQFPAGTPVEMATVGAFPKVSGFIEPVQCGLKVIQPKITIHY